jgi:predicted dehydrogenase
MNPDHESSLTSGQTRRSFIKATAGIAATAATAGLLKTPVYGQAQAPSANVLGANSRIALGIIGTGSQGKNHIRLLKPHLERYNVSIAAVCDLFEKHLNQAKSLAGVSDANAYRDHRKLLERKDIDAVIIASVDNWHADHTMDALNAGKHVYCEKPMTRYAGEGWKVYDTVKRTGKVFQCGSQYTADPMIHKAAEWIKGGKLGPLSWAQGSYCRNNPRNSEWTYPVDADANPVNLDWSRWLGRAPQIAWNPDHYFSWHKFYAYNSGLLGNLMSHRFYPLMLATGNPEWPRRISCTGTRKISTDREITDTTHVLAEFPSGLTFVIVGSTVNEQGLPDTIRGRKGTLYLSGSQNRMEFRPEKIFSDEADPEEFSDPKRFGRIEHLHEDFFKCMREGGTTFCNVDLTVRANTVLCLAEMSERLNLTLMFDEKTRQITTGEGTVIPPIDYDSKIPTPAPIPL